MAEVLARHHISVGNEGGWYCSSFGCEPFAHFHKATQHQEAMLMAAGFGPVKAAAAEALRDAAVLYMAENADVNQASGNPVATQEQWRFFHWLGLRAASIEVTQ
jgi:hypothetical protein